MYLRKNLLLLFLLAGVVFCTDSFAQVILSERRQVVELSDYSFLESEKLEGNNISGDPITQGFKKYDGNLWSSSGEVGKIMFTFRTTFKVSEDLKKERISIYVGPQEYPYTLFLNGALISRVGVHNNAMSYSVFSAHHIQLMAEHLNFGDKENELAFQIYPQHRVFPIDKLYLSTYENNVAAVFWRNFFNVNLAQAASITALIISFYFFFLFFTLKSGSTRRNLYFAIVCLTYALTTVQISLTNDASDKFLTFQISRTGFVLTGTFIFLFFTEMTGILARKRILNFAVLAASALIVLLPFSFGSLSSSEWYFSNISSLYAFAYVVASIVLVCMAIIKDKRRNFIIILFAMGAMVLTAGHDIISLNKGLPYCWMVPYGFFMLLISMFILMALEQARYQDEVMERQQESINSLTIAQEETNMALKTSDQQKQIVESLTEKTVSGMEQMSATVKITASRSTTADGLSSKTAALVKDGAVLSGKAKRAMQQISADNEKISKIVKVVNKIAFQTNLLAINAAIEAAKAGESGSGFSVVAAEVRNLAKNSSDAANEINDLIIKSIGGIQNGVMLVDDNAKKLSEIDENISQFIAIVKEIFATTNEQQQMVDSINDFMQELNAAVLALREEH